MWADQQIYGYIPSRIAKKLSMKITKNPSAMSFRQRKRKQKERAKKKYAVNEPESVNPIRIRRKQYRVQRKDTWLMKTCNANFFRATKTKIMKNGTHHYFCMVASK